MKIVGFLGWMKKTRQEHDRATLDERKTVENEKERYKRALGEDRNEEVVVNHDWKIQRI